MPGVLRTMAVYYSIGLINVKSNPMYICLIFRVERKERARLKSVKFSGKGSLDRVRILCKVKGHDVLQ